MQLWERVRKAACTAPPLGLRDGYSLDCAQHNNRRYAVMPWVHILANLLYLPFFFFFYPQVYPDRVRPAPVLYLMLSVLCMAWNLAFVPLFRRLGERRGREGYVRAGNTALYSYLLGYSLLECVWSVLEVAASGNLYRFLLSYAAVVCLPRLRRGVSQLFVLLHGLFFAAGVEWMGWYGLGFHRYYLWLAAAFLLICSLLCHAVYTSSVRAFLLKHQLLEANQRLQELTVTDPLTGVGNRRAFGDYIRRIWDACKRNQQPIGAMMIDIDRFKEYNDHYGHQQGDECLKQVARYIQEQFGRSMDMVARYGGEEFVVLMPYNDPDGVALKAQALCRGLRELGIPHLGLGTEGVVTVSIGAASTVPGRQERYETFIKRVDDALYRAKRDGRDCVFMDRGRQAS